MLVVLRSSTASHRFQLALQLDERSLITLIEMPSRAGTSDLNYLIDCEE
jgi:hypothetical protein